MDRQQLPTPLEMVAHLNRFVLGQSEAKIDISVAIYNHYLSQTWSQEHGGDLGRHHILLIGPTGSGKTFIVQSLAKFLGVPFAVCSATNLVEVGFRGRHVDDIVCSLLEKVGNNPRVAEKGIIFIDEIDKIKQMDSGGSRDISGEGVQNALLTMLDGRISDGSDGNKHPAVDTGKILFVCSGAFVGLDEIISERIGESDSPKMGLRRPEKSSFPNITIDKHFQLLRQANTSDFVSFGFIPELVGRFSTITMLHELNRQDFREIISSTIENSALARQKKIAEIHGIDLVFTVEAMDAISEKAHDLKTGVRALNRIIGDALQKVDYKWPDLANEGITRVTITKECIENASEPVYESIATVYTRSDLDLRMKAFAHIPTLKDNTEIKTIVAGCRHFTDTTGWSGEKIWKKIDNIKINAIGIDTKAHWSLIANPGSSAAKWWMAFEEENRNRPGLLLRLCEEIEQRNTSIYEFFLAFVYANVDSIQCVLHYLDYILCKKEYNASKSKNPPPNTDNDAPS